MTHSLHRSLRLYLVLDPDHVSGDAFTTTQHAVENGVSCVQLRWKTSTDREFIELAKALRVLTEAHGVPLVVNDRLDIALVAGADGVHVGVDDIPVEDARRVGGRDFIIGYSPETDRQTSEASGAGATYLGIGPIFGTTTKSDAGPALGAAEFSRRRELTELPVVAIGGIDHRNAADAMAAGADGVAVASAILGSDDPGTAARKLSEAIQRQP